MSKVELRVPTIGESVTEVTLSQWLKEDGAYVEMDEAICEFESDKATLEFPSEDSGELKHVAEEGQDLEIGDLVAELDTDAEADSGEEEAGEGEEKNFSEDESAEEKGEEASGEQSSEEDATDDETKQEEAKTDEQDKGEEKEEHYAKGHAAPAAGKLMREHNLEASDIDGTGKNGRILKEDVQGVIEDRESAEESREKKKEGQQSVEEDSSESAPGRETLSRETSRERMSRMRRTIASHLVSAKNDTAMLTTFNEADMSEVIALRKKYQEEFVEKFDIKLGFMSIFAKACAQILLRMPDVNAFKDGDELVYHDYADISIAISTDNGLVVPPVHNVESLHFAEIEKKIKILAEKAREGTLSLEEMQGGTFTITNGGIFGSLVSTPILNAPQSAILGMHAIQERPVAIDGEVEVRPMMYLALSYDHQVIDGKTAVTFLVEVKKLLEDPMKLFLDL